MSTPVEEFATIGSITAEYGKLSVAQRPGICPDLSVEEYGSWEAVQNSLIAYAETQGLQKFKELRLGSLKNVERVSPLIDGLLSALNIEALPTALDVHSVHVIGRWFDALSACKELEDLVSSIKKKIRVGVLWRDPITGILVKDWVHALNFTEDTAYFFVQSDWLSPEEVEQYTTNLGEQFYMRFAGLKAGLSLLIPSITRIRLIVLRPCDPHDCAIFDFGADLISAGFCAWFSGLRKISRCPQPSNGQWPPYTILGKDFLE